MMRLKTLLPIVLVSSVGFDALAGYVTKTEPNDILAAAMNVDAHFDLANDPLIHNVALVNTSTTIPHASVIARGSNPASYDWYSFTAQAGSLVILDADYGMNDIDSWFRVYNGAGSLLYSNDDFGFSGGNDPGSIHPFDSFIQFTASYSGLYYLQVSQFVQSPINQNQDYYVHFSVQNHSTVPDGGSSMAMLALGVLGLVGYRGTKRHE